MTRWLPTAAGGISILTTLILIARDYPLVGHDYRYFIPRLIDTDLHLRLNGPWIQWYTPSFGSGIPAFPNPQHLQYSLVQALTFISNPWIAVLATTAIALAIGFWACYRIARTHLGLGVTAATLAALFFISNGFTIGHAIVGHVSFQLFPLTALMLWVLLDRRRGDLARGALLGLTIALMLYHGGAIVIILGAMALALCLPLLVALRPQLCDGHGWWRTFAVAASFSAAITAPKIVSGLMLIEQFPRHVFVDPAVPLMRAFAGLLSQFAGVQVIAPLLAAVGLEPSRAYGVMVRLSGTRRLGMWELDTGLSPILFVCLAIGGWMMWRSRQATSVTPRRPVQRGALALFALGAWIVMEATLDHGVIFPLIKTLPVMNTLHVAPRFGAVLILPLALLAGVAIDRWLSNRRAIGLVLVVATCAMPLSYFMLPGSLHDRSFHVASSIRDAASLRDHDGGVTQVALVTDAEALSIGASSLRPYDPLFGYGNESFSPETREGDARVVTDGYWNMTHPASLVFPHENGLRKFERIREDDRERLEQFLQRRQPAWSLPSSVEWAVRLAVPALVLCLIVIASGFRRGRAGE